MALRATRFCAVFRAALPSGTLPIREQLATAFEKKMSNSNAPLLRDFETYARSLPVRLIGGEHVPLHEVPFWAKQSDGKAKQSDGKAKQSDVKAMARKLEAPPKEGARLAVKYLAAPGASGKTSSILPAFLESHFTHYLYIACTNNGRRRFTVTPPVPDKNPELAKEQGAAFMAECVRMLLHGREDGPFKVPLNEAPPTLDDTVASLQNDLEEMVGPHAKVLFHIDEHRKMCYRKSPEEGPDPSGAAFSRGAFECLAAMQGCTTVATHTAALSLPPVSSSEVCRQPVALVCPDLDALMNDTDELRYIPKNLNVGQERVWATVRFRLGMHLKTELGSLHRRGSNRVVEEFLTEYQRITQQSTDVQQILDKLAAHCQVKLSKGRKRPEPNAASLLVGIPEGEQDDWERQVRNLVLVDDLVTASLEELLKIYDPNMHVYAQGRNRFRKLLSNKDLLAQTPLEVAYSWVLACMASLTGELTFLDEGDTFQFRCGETSPGRLFPGTDKRVYDVRAVKKGILYYADEEGKDKQGRGKTKHPLADLFFCTDKDELVLVNVTGTSDTKVAEEKREKLAEWIHNEQPSMEGGMTLKGIVLAPWVDEESTIGSTVCMVCGDDARQLLGGLGQLARWL